MQEAAALQASAPEEVRTLWVGQLPAEVTEASLLDAFAHEQLVSAQIAKDARSSASLGYGFLTFATHQAAQAFLLTFSSRSLADAMPLKLRWASQETPRHPGASLGETEVPDSHSLFVGDLPPEVSDLQLQQHFQQYFPTATSAKVITDRLSGQSKGYGFIRFTSAEERDRALSVMNGQKFGQQTIRVNRAKAKKYQGDGLYYPSDYDANNTTIFVGNVNTDITEEDLFSVFKRCGEILSVKLLKAKGCAFITYANRDAAERAINYLHGKVIKNSAVRLCWGRRSIYNSYPLPHPLLTAAQQQSMLSHPPMQSYTAQLGPPAYPAQGFIPQQHFNAPPLHPAQGFQAPSALGYQTQPFWRADLPQDLQSQQYGGQLGIAQGLIPQPLLSQTVPNFTPVQGLPRQIAQSQYLPSSMGIPTIGANLPSGAPVDNETQYRSPASLVSYSSVAPKPAAKVPRRQTLADTEEVLAQLNLGAGPSRSSF